MNFIEQQDQFVKFIESYSPYLKPAYIIAKNNDDESLINIKKKGNNFKFYSLDDICKTRSIFWKNEPNITPKTTDALWFNKGNDGNFFIYLIEFKGDKLENQSAKQKFEDYIDELKEKKQAALNNIEKREIQGIINNISPFCNKYSDSMLNSLVLKPLETITISLPLIYKDYYEKNKDNNEVKYIDIKYFLRKSIINYYVVIFCEKDVENCSNFINNGFRIRTVNNTYGNAIVDEYSQNNDSELKDNYKNSLNTYYERYKKAEIFNFYDYLDPSQLNTFIMNTFIED